MKDLIKHRISHLSAGGKIITDETAKIGDILLSDNTWITSAAYAEHKDEIKAKPVGICGIPKGVLPDGKGRLVSVDFMDYNNPEQGSEVPVEVVWGDTVTNFPENMCTCGFWKTSASDNSQITGVTKNHNAIPSNYMKKTYESNVYPKHYYKEGGGPPVYPMLSSFLSGEKLNPSIFLEETTLPGTSTTTSLRENYEERFKIAQTDFDGKGNTDRIIAATTATATSIINNKNPGNFPAANCCHLYKKGNREWYLPAIGEVIMIYQNFVQLEITFINYRGFFNDISDLDLWSSSCVQTLESQSSSTSAFGVSPSTGYVYYGDRYYSYCVLAVSTF